MGKKYKKENLEVEMVSIESKAGVEKTFGSAWSLCHLRTPRRRRFRAETLFVLGDIPVGGRGRSLDI